MVVIWAAFFNFAAFLIFGTHVASTIGGDLLHDLIVPTLVCWFCSCVDCAVIWNLITWYLGLPPSSHALIGAMAV
jgi:PiT family inorganic phosphate transporter